MILKFKQTLEIGHHNCHRIKFPSTRFNSKSDEQNYLQQTIIHLAHFQSGNTTEILFIKDVLQTHYATLIPDWLVSHGTL